MGDNSPVYWNCDWIWMRFLRKEVSFRLQNIQTSDTISSSEANHSEGVGCLQEELNIPKYDIIYKVYYTGFLKSEVVRNLKKDICLIGHRHSLNHPRLASLVLIQSFCFGKNRLHGNG